MDVVQFADRQTVRATYWMSAAVVLVNIFIPLSVPLTVVDVLSAAGWATMAWALHLIADKDARIPPLKWMAVVFLTVQVACVTASHLIGEVRTPAGIRTWLSPASVLAVPITPLHIIFTWRLYGLVMDLAVALQSPALRVEAQWTRRVLVTMQLLLPCAACVAVLVPPVALLFMPATIIALLTAIALGLMVVGELRRVVKRAMGSKEAYEKAGELEG